jgi:hypothetical protein
MSPDEFLLGAARALRDDGRRASASSSATRAAIVYRVVTRQRRRRALGVCATALVMVFGASTAWATAKGHVHWRDVLRRLAVHAQPVEDSRLSPTPRSVSSHCAPTVPPIVPPIVADVAAHEAPRTIEPNAPIPSAPAARSTPRIASRVPRVTAPSPATQAPDAVDGTSEAPTSLAHVESDNAAPASSPPSNDDPRDGVFRDAQHADFHDHDAARALAGWEAYLRAAPDGRFALEAAYNRAIDLVRLGRRDEAIDALTPFASGAHGAYRHREASQLIDALRASSSSGAPR